MKITPSMLSGKTETAFNKMLAECWKATADASRYGCGVVEVSSDGDVNHVPIADRKKNPR